MAEDLEIPAMDGSTRDSLRRELAEVRAQLTKLEAFKTYVHKRLDQALVPPNPEPAANAQHGCRIEGRLNWLLTQRDELKQLTLDQQHFNQRLIVEADEHEQMIDALGQICCGVAFTNGQYEEANERARTHSSCAFCGESEPLAAIREHMLRCRMHPLGPLLSALKPLSDDISDAADTDRRWEVLYEAYRAALAAEPRTVAPAGGCWVKCPRCMRVGPHFVAEGEPILFCAQCSLGENVKVRFVACAQPDLIAPGAGVTDRG